MSGTRTGQGPSAAGSAKSTAQSAADSPWVDRLARLGLLARGLVYGLIGLLAGQIALGERGEKASQAGAFQSIAEKPFGKFVLWLVVLGFIGYAAWRATEALWGHREEDGSKRTFERVVSGVKVALYLGLALLAARIAMGNPQAGDKGGETVTAKLLKETGGRWLVGIVGLVILGAGLYMIVEGIRASFEKHLKAGQMTPASKRNVIRLGRVGYIARGVAFGIMGILVVTAAVRFDPKKAEGLDLALRELASQPFGPWLLLAVAFGLVCFGIYSAVESRYRRL